MGNILQSDTSSKRMHCVSKVLTHGKCGNKDIVYNPATVYCKKYSCSAVCDKTGRRCTNLAMGREGLGRLSMLVLELDFSSACCKLCVEHFSQMKRRLQKISHAASRQIILYYLSKDITKVYIIFRNPAEYVPQSNSMAEKAVREFKEQLEPTKVVFERQIKTNMI